MKLRVIEGAGMGPLIFACSSLDKLLVGKTVREFTGMTALRPACMTNRNLKQRVCEMLALRLEGS